MKAAVWHAARDVRVMEVPEPQPGPHDVKIRVEWCGICGSDLHEYMEGPITIPTGEAHPLTGQKAPVILGHEFSGTVVECGADVQGLAVGDRVVADANQVCWNCYSCRRMDYHLCETIALTGLMGDGALAEYVKVPDYCCYPVGDDVTDEQAALVEPLAVGMHAVRKAPIVEGDNVAIIGAGTIGLAVLQCARAAGAGQVIVVEPVEARRKFALDLGASVVLDPFSSDATAEIMALTGGIGADVCLECVGVGPTAQAAVDATRRGGKTVLVGIFGAPAELNLFDVVTKEKQLIGSVTYNGEFSPVLRMLGDGRLNAEPMITKKIRLADIIDEGFEELIRNPENHIKIIVTPK